MVVHQLSRADARRIAVRAQLLDADRPTDLVAMLRHLAFVQVEPTAVVAPSADLVAWSRLGASYKPADLVDALETRTLVELLGLLRPSEDIALFRAAMAQWPGTGVLKEWQEDQAEWVEANDTCRTDILALLSTSGPLTSRDLPDTCEVPWRSSGWTNNQNVIKLLDFMVLRGEVAVAGRDGRERLWDLAERVYPEVPTVAGDEAVLMRNERRLTALGIARERAPVTPMEPNDVGQSGEEAVVDGVKGTWRADPAQLDRLAEPFKGRVALISPLDRLVYDRKRMLELFEFDYQLEMYKPAAKRRWGFYALPVLQGDRLVGKLDATADRKAGALFVDAVHEDEPFSKATAAAVDREIRDLAAWLGLELARTDATS